MAQRAWRIRWSVFALLFGLAICGYVQRTGIAIAAERMLPELGLTRVQFGWLLNAFLIAYTALQVPGAVAGQWLGARRALVLVGLISTFASAAIALLPSAQAVGVLLALALLSRAVLGMAQAALFPVASGVIEAWFPLRSWGSAQGLIVTGLWIGAAITPPTIAWLMTRWGWRPALVISSAPALLLVLAWRQYAEDDPARHPSIRPQELAELSANPQIQARRVTGAELLELLRDRPVALLTLSYFLMNYVFYLVTFWCFLYLVQERHFTVLEGGGLASLPFLFAAVAAAAGGRLCDALSARYGVRWGMRLVPLLALPGSACFLVLTGALSDAYLAVVSLCLAFAFSELTEGTYWAATMRAAPRQVMPGTALLNMGGNLGGVVATPTIAALSEAHRWSSIFGLGALLAVLAAAVMLLVDVKPSATAEGDT
ncbi:MAG: MFS transporter [Gammaproteobacteria bacterium]|nr:MFS transporter [Gammaproteobacteria bacterium]